MVFMSLLHHGIPSLSFLLEKLVLPCQSPGHNTGGPSKYLSPLVNKNLFVLRKKKIKNVWLHLPVPKFLIVSL